MVKITKLKSEKYKGRTINFSKNVLKDGKILVVGVFNKGGLFIKETGSTKAIAFRKVKSKMESLGGF